MEIYLVTIRRQVITCMFAFISLQNYSQSLIPQKGKFEIGLVIGSMFFLGDLGGTQGTGKGFIKDLDLPLARFNKGLQIHYYPTEHFGLCLAGNHGSVEGNDALAPARNGAEEDRRLRNLSFKSKIEEVYVAFEFYPISFWKKNNGSEGKLQSYVLAGAGIFHFDPETKDVDGNRVKLAPLRLEGQGFPQYPDSKPYKLTQINLLGGLGFKYNIGENACIGLEILHRMLFTDYVDDVSSDYYINPEYFDQNLPAADAIIARRLFYRGLYSYPTTRPYEEFAKRGDPKQNDSYFSINLRFGWRVKVSDYRSKQLRCPVFY